MALRSRVPNADSSESDDDGASGHVVPLLGRELLQFMQMSPGAPAPEPSACMQRLCTFGHRLDTEARRLVEQQLATYAQTYEAMCMARCTRLKKKAKHLKRSVRTKMLAEMDRTQFEDAVASIEHATELHFPKLCASVDKLLPHGWAELLRVIADALRAQGHDEHTPYNARGAKLPHVQCINGDMQRGKSTVEALMAAIVQTVNNSPACADRCCTFLVTQLQAWADALKDTVETKAGDDDDHEHEHAYRAGSDDDEDDDDEALAPGAESVDHSWLCGLRIFCMYGAGRGVKEKAKVILRQGGTCMGFRTHAQWENMGKAIAELNNQLNVDDVRTVPILLLDEGDKMMGNDGYLHAQMMNRFCGFDPGYYSSNKPALISCVSATNVGPFYWFLNRVHQRAARGNSLMFKFFDVVSFCGADEHTYRERSVSALPSGDFTEPPRPSENYVTDQIVELWRKFLATPYACFLDTASSRVNLGVDANMQVHVHQLNDSLAQTERHQVGVVYVHGSSQTFLGKMGIEFLNEDGLAPEDSGLATLHAAHLTAADAEREAGNDRLADALESAADELGDSLLDGRYIPVHSLTALGWHVKEEALRRGFYRERQMQGMLDQAPHFDLENYSKATPWKTDNLSLVIYILRKFVRMDLPLAIVGGTMVRRSLSIVAVDYTVPPISAETDVEGIYDQKVYGQSVCISLVTHAVHTRFSNSADATQTNGRLNTTLTNFCARHPHLETVIDITVEDTSVATLAFKQFNASPEFRQSLKERTCLMANMTNALSNAGAQRSVQSVRTRLSADEQFAWFRELYTQLNHHSAQHVGDANVLRAQGCALALNLPLGEHMIRMLQTHKNPMFQAGSGLQERNVGNVHAIVCCILANVEPHTFQHALARRRGGARGARGSGPLGGVAQLILRWMCVNNYRAANDGTPGGANPGPGVYQACWQIHVGVAAAHADDIARGGYAELRVRPPGAQRQAHGSARATGGGGPGRALQSLYEQGRLARTTTRAMKRNGHFGEIHVYWVPRNILPTGAASADPPTADPPTATGGGA